MRRSIVVLLLLLHCCSAGITTNVAATICNALKLKCDALPYRTVYTESNCYFVIDAPNDPSGTSQKCSLILPGAKLAGRAPDGVWEWLFVDKNDFLFAGSTATEQKKKAMCIYENAEPCAPDLSRSRASEGTCSARLAKKEEQKFAARMITEHVNQVSPVIVELPEKQEEGQTMIFKAIAKPGRNEFSIELNSAGGASIALIVYIMFAQRQIKLNSFANRAWGADEIKPHTLQIDQNFEIMIRTRADHFKICIDGKDFAEYKYRQPLSSITHFMVKGYGFLNSYQLGAKKTSFPSMIGASDTFPICNKTNTESKCKSLVVTGTLASEYWRTHINLVRRNGDIALHFELTYTKQPNFILFDTLTNGRWWIKQEIMNKQYLKPLDLIELEIMHEEAGFQIYVNGESIHFIKHRMPSFDLTIVETSGLREPVITFREAKEEKFVARMITEKTGQYSPVIVELPEKLESGQEMTFNCTAKPGKNDFTIQLQSADGKDIAFVIFIQFSQRQIQLNSFKGTWGTAEIISHNLVIDRNFEVSVRALDDHFKVRINRKDFAEYKYRQPLSSITHFKVVGYGYLNSYRLGEKYKAYPSVPDVVAADSFPICKNSVPRSKCKSLVVSGILATEYQRVSINLIRKNDDIAIHFNPRYDQPTGFLLFDVQTSLNWWVSNRDIVFKKYPKQGEHIEVEFVNEEAGFQIFVNNVSTHFFKHRMPSFDIVGVETSSIREPVISFREAKEPRFFARMITERTNQYSPVIVELLEKLESGQEITFNIHALPGKNDFTIQLQSADGKDIAFVVYIQFAQRQIQLNSFKLAWGAAEIKPHTLFIDQSFEVSIQALDDHFKVRIDGEDFGEYNYRQPLSSITHFMVKGYGYLNSYKLGEKYKSVPSVTGVPETFPICNKTVTKTNCKALVVSGTIATEHQRVAISLLRKNDDIPIVFQLDYDAGQRELFDTLTNGQWWYKQELAFKPHPKKGERLEVEFVHEEAGFQVSMNGVPTYFFKHRMPSFDIVGVETQSLREPVVSFK